MQIRHMRKCTQGLCLLVGFISVLLLVTASVSPAGVVTQMYPIDFGSVDLHPSGDTIVIAAQNGPATPTSSHSVVTGGGSGMLIVTSPTAEQVEVVYPFSLILTGGGHSVTISGIPSLSQKTATLPGGGVSRNLSIGGSLNLASTANRGSYSGTMTIQINFF